MYSRLVPSRKEIVGQLGETPNGHTEFHGTVVLLYFGFPMVGVKSEL